MSGYSTTPISAWFKPGVAVDDSDQAVQQALRAAIPAVTAAMQHGRPDRATLERARVAYVRASRLPMSTPQRKQQPKAIAEAQRKLNEAPARDVALLELLRVGLQMAAANAMARNDGHAAAAFEQGIELMRACLVIMCKAFNEGTIIDAGDIAA